MKYVLGIDPGETCGYALFAASADSPEKTDVVHMGQFTHDQTNDLLNKLSEDKKIDTIVAEDYRVYKQHAGRHAGDRLITARVLGKIESYCELNGITLIYQMADILPIAQKWTQVKLPKNHAISHQFSAYNHAMFYMIKRDLALSALAKELKENK